MMGIHSILWRSKKKKYCVVTICKNVLWTLFSLNIVFQTSKYLRTWFQKLIKKSNEEMVKMHKNNIDTNADKQG